MPQNHIQYLKYYEIYFKRIPEQKPYTAYQHQAVLHDQL